MKPRSVMVSIPVGCRTLETWARQRDRLAEIMGQEMADKYFVWTDPNPPKIPDGEVMNPVREARDLFSFMQRNQLNIDEMREWILVSEKEQRAIEEWCSSDLSLLSFTNTMVDFRREVWGEFLVLLEKEEHLNARRSIRNDRVRGEHRRAVCM